MRMTKSFNLVGKRVKIVPNNIDKFNPIYGVLLKANTNFLLVDTGDFEGIIIVNANSIFKISLAENKVK